MWYNIWHEDGTGDIAYAESDDGISWTKSPINPVLSPGTPGQWGQPAVAFVEGSDGSVLDGFTVRNGEALRGGGILVEGTGGTIRNCTVVNNTAYETGGGVMINSGARAVIQSNQILSNTVPESPGSGVCIDSSEVLLDSNLIAYNACTDYVHGNGAIGIDMDGPSLPVTVTNNVVVFNTDKGIMVNDGVHDLQIINNTIASNRNEGILAWGTITVSLLRNNIIALNGYDCGIAAAQGAEFQTLDHNDVWQDDYCDYGGAVNPPTPGIGSISEDPLFVDVANGDFHLQADSPCIDAGTSVGAPATDIEGTLRDAIPDIGAYEWGKYRIFLPLTLRNVGS
ncbi:MAG: right-handed parallel beta-helix repeat-containing protein [Chloroflexota bacterium]|nr:right-handed parallel beta-helix repeat-containing protein [Chloroflexota bacterium]